MDGWMVGATCWWCEDVAARKGNATLCCSKEGGMDGHNGGGALGMRGAFDRRHMLKIHSPL